MNGFNERYCWLQLGVRNKTRKMGTASTLEGRLKKKRIPHSKRKKKIRNNKKGF